MERLRKGLTYFNMKKLAEKSGVSYQVLRNFSSNRKEYLRRKEYDAIIVAMIEIIMEVK